MPTEKTDRAKPSAKGIEVSVSGTSPLSFDVLPGAILVVKEFAPSHYTRPTAGSGFKKSGFLLFHNQTKVGRLSPDSISLLGKKIPSKCRVSEVDKQRKVLRVVFE